MLLRGYVERRLAKCVLLCEKRWRAVVVVDDVQDGILAVLGSETRCYVPQGVAFGIWDLEYVLAVKVDPVLHFVQSTCFTLVGRNSRNNPPNVSLRLALHRISDVHVLSQIHRCFVQYVLDVQERNRKVGPLKQEFDCLKPAHHCSLVESGIVFIVLLNEELLALLLGCFVIEQPHDVNFAAQHSILERGVVHSRSGVDEVS
mmetsp:Transcript_25653/g.63625  ORF Transcript_25653/g.63625 Transcript_25653/m.63625 type:complete len:202 (-) Transcript_25653:1383-1988(-)